jgi:nitroreductase
MLMQKVMEKRRSVREYKHKELEAQDLEILQEIIDQVPTIVSSVQVRFHLVRHGASAFKALTGVAGYNGVMIEAPHYLVILSNAHDHQFKASGYVAEWLVLNLTKHNIGSCWIDTNKQGDQIKNILNLETTDDVVGLLAIGYGAKDVRLSNVFEVNGGVTVATIGSTGYPKMAVNYVPVPVSGRVAIHELVYLNQWGDSLTFDELEQRGLSEVFYYMRLAPSWGNQQPWKFILHKNQILLAVKKEYGASDSRITEIDAGIAMLYFETAMHSEGLTGAWSFTELENRVSIPDAYVLAGVYTY